MISSWEHWRAAGRGRSPRSFHSGRGVQGGLPKPPWRGFGPGAPKSWQFWRLFSLVCSTKMPFQTHVLPSYTYLSIPTRCRLSVAGMHHRLVAKWRWMLLICRYMHIWHAHILSGVKLGILQQQQQTFKVWQPQRGARSKRPNTPSDGSKHNGFQHNWAF